MSFPQNMNSTEAAGNDNPNDFQFDLGEYDNMDNLQDQNFDDWFNGTDFGTGLTQSDFDQLEGQDSQHTNLASAAQDQSANTMQGSHEDDMDVTLSTGGLAADHNTAPGGAQDFQQYGDFDLQLNTFSGLYQMPVGMSQVAQMPFQHVPAAPRNSVGIINSLFDPRIGWYYPALHDAQIGPYMPAPGANSEYYSTISRANQAPVAPSDDRGTRVKRPRVHKRSIVQDCTCGDYHEKVPRPCNRFILYRNDKQKQILARKSGLCQQGASRQAAAAWKTESPAVKEHYRKLAEEAKRKHKLAYPNYKFEPGKAAAVKFGTPNCTCGAYLANMQARQARAGADNGADTAASVSNTPAHDNFEGELDDDLESESLYDSDEKFSRPVKRARKSRTAAARSQHISRSDPPVLDNTILEGLPMHQRAEATAALSKKRKRAADNHPAQISNGLYTTRSARGSPDMMTEKQYLCKGNWYTSLAPERPGWAEDEREIQVENKRF